MHNKHILYGTVPRTISPGIRKHADSDGKTGAGGNFRLSHAVPRYIHMAQAITQLQKLHSQLVVLMTAVMYQSDQFNVQFRARHGSPTREQNPQ